MADEDLVAIVAAILSVREKSEPEDCLERAVYLVVSARRHVAENKETQALRIWADALGDGNPAHAPVKTGG